MRNLFIRFGVALVAICGLSSTLSAGMDCFDWCDGDFEVGAHALYWKPMHCALAFAQTTDAGPPQVTTVRDIKADYDWGFRVFAGYVQDCTFADASYLWLETGDPAELNTGILNISPVGLNSTNSPRTRAFLGFSYMNVDVRVGQFLHHQCGCDFSVFANARWVHLRRKNRNKADTFTGGFPGATSWVQRAEFDGGGLGVGTSGEFCVWNGFNFFGAFNFMGVIGNRKTNLSRLITNDTGGVTNIAWSSNQCIIPAMDFRLGVNYSWNCMCTTLIFELGYEGNYYWNALEFQRGVAGNPPTNNTARDCEHIGFAGPFFGARVLF